MRRLITALVCVVVLSAGLRAAEPVAAAAKPTPRAAWVMHFDGDWLVAKGMPEKAMLVSLQGLANRAAPQLYVVHPKDFQWEITGPLFEFYQRKHGVVFTDVKTADDALTLFAKHAKGYVVWEPAVPATMNVAFTIAGLEDAVIVTDAQVALVESDALAAVEWSPAVVGHLAGFALCPPAVAGAMISMWSTMSATS